MRILNIFFPFLFITSSKSFKFSHINFKHIVNANEKIYEKYDNLGEYKEYFEPNLFSTIHHLVDKSNIYQEINKNIELFNQQAGKETVKFVSSALPHVDSIGHQILHANNIYINNILTNPNIPHDIQKMLILASIKLAQYGDDMGSELLKMYYNLVDNCL